MQIPDNLYRHVIRHVRKMMKDHDGVRLRMWKSKRFMNGEVGSEAWFDADSRFVDVATKGHDRADILMSLLHEMGHVTQWYNRGTGNDLWGKCMIPVQTGYRDATDIINDWVEDQWRVSMWNALEAFKAIYKLEADAEEHALHYARYFGLHGYINLSDYARGANLYLKSYVYTWQRREFLPANKPPYQFKKLLFCQPSYIEHEWPDHNKVVRITAQFMDAYEAPAK